MNWEQNHNYFPAGFNGWDFFLDWSDSGEQHPGNWIYMKVSSDVTIVIKCSVTKTLNN